MQLTRMKKLLSFILCMVLIAAVALFTYGCNDHQNTDDTGSGSSETTTGSEAPVSPESDVTTLGEGATKFFFTVVEKDGKETKFEIHTDKTTVGEALLELNLIAGEQGAYGLYVKTVNGITADYDVDGTYWAFYIGGEYGMSGVDTTTITAGETYSFKVE